MLRRPPIKFKEARATLGGSLYQRLEKERNAHKDGCPLLPRSQPQTCGDCVRLKREMEAIDLACGVFHTMEKLQDPTD